MSSLLHPTNNRRTRREQGGAPEGPVPRTGSLRSQSSGRTGLKVAANQCERNPEDKAAAYVCLRLVGPLPFGVDGRRFLPAVCAKPGGKRVEMQGQGGSAAEILSVFAGEPVSPRRARGLARQGQDPCVLPVCLAGLCDASQAKFKRKMVSGSKFNAVCAFGRESQSAAPTRACVNPSEGGKARASECLTPGAWRGSGSARWWHERTNR